MSEEEKLVQTRGRAIPWLQVVQFHEEIVKRAEKGFYALNGNDALSNRWSSLSGFNPDQLSGPWTLPTISITSRPFLQAFEAQEHEAIYMGGPCFLAWEKVGDKFHALWQPILYREVSIEEVDDDLLIEPAQGEWNISPLFYALLDQRSISVPENVDGFVARILELATGRRAAGSPTMAQAVLDALCSEFPGIETEMTRHLERNPFKIEPSSWVLFAPTSQFSAMTRYLLRDYERLHSILKRIPASIGGLSILEDGTRDAVRFDYEAIPVVPLDDAQKRAVDAVLKGDPLTVISGPPGCGKSQVVVSLLLNAWARGLKVLFASNNNKAVDVVRERLERFEQDTPIAVRAGNRTKARVEEVLRRIINLVAQVRRGDTKAIDPAAIAQRQQTLLIARQKIQTSLDSGLPQRVHEAVESALKGYSSHRRLLAEIEAEEAALLSSYGQLSFIEKVKPEELAELLDQHRDWVKSHTDCRKQVEADRRTQSELTRQLEALRRKRTRLLKEVGGQLQPGEDGRWLLSGPSPEDFDRVAIELKSAAEAITAEDLQTETWHEGFDRWTGEENALAWAAKAEAYARDILSLVNDLTPQLKVLEDLTSRYIQRRESLLESGIPEGLSLTRVDLETWAAVYSRFLTHEPSWVDVLPWSVLARQRRELKRCEGDFRRAFPLPVWRHVGSLTADGRERLADVVERSRLWLEVREEWSESRRQIEVIEKRQQEMLRRAGELEYQSLPDSRDMDAWSAFRERVRQDTALARDASVAWTQRVRREQSQSTLTSHASRLQDFGAGYPLKEDWARGPGSMLVAAVAELRREPHWDHLQTLRTQLYSGALGQLISIWRQTRDCEEEVQDAARRLADVPLESDRVADWWRTGPRRKLLLHKVPEQLTDETELLASLAPYVKWEESWSAFQDRSLPAKQADARRELDWALSQLDETLETLPAGEERDRFGQHLGNIHQDPEVDWPLADISDATAAFSPERLKARIDAIEVELEKTSFETAKSDWISRLIQDDETVRAVDSLEKNLRQSQGQIEPGDHELFRRAMTAVPIWICTAQAPQHIPLEPDLFDIVVIDEATQCTLTNLLPLVYRGKRLVVIGDGNQLPAIPTIRGTEERVLAKKYGVAGLLDFIGHSENDVYSTATHSLPRRRADVVMLTDHYRCHPQIIGFSNNQIYQRELRLRRDPLMRSVLLAGSGVHVVEVTGQVVRGDKGRSWCNPPESTAVADLVAMLRAQEDSGLSIGVVAPFRGQVERIIEELDKRKASRNVLVGTAHQFQGDERDIMIFSPVVGRGMPDTSAKWVESPPNLINVAVTRAKEALFVVGDIEFCSRQDGILKQLARYCRTIQLLRDTSPAELELFSWMCVEGWNPEVHPVVGDIEVDFVLVTPSGEKLAIEVDGEEGPTGHKKRRAQDQARDAYLIARGFTVLRFTARDVFETPGRVIHQIKARMEAQ